VYRKVVFLSAKEENKYLYNQSANAYAIRTKAFGAARFGGDDPTEERHGPVGSREHLKKTHFLIGFALIAAVLVSLAILLLHA
jgi:hypothetical protein